MYCIYTVHKNLGVCALYSLGVYICVSLIVYYLLIPCSKYGQYALNVNVKCKCKNVMRKKIRTVISEVSSFVGNPVELLNLYILKVAVVDLRQGVGEGRGEGATRYSYKKLFNPKYIYIYHTYILLIHKWKDKLFGEFWKPEKYKL